MSYQLITLWKYRIDFNRYHCFISEAKSLFVRNDTIAMRMAQSVQYSTHLHSKILYCITLHDYNTKEL